MNFNDYQKQAITTDSYGGAPQEINSEAFYNKLLGLCSESGEVADKFKKIFRNKQGNMSAEDTQEIIKELGDVLWYVSAIAAYLEVPLDDVVQANLSKLFDRKKRGAIESTGDNR